MQVGDGKPIDRAAMIEAASRSLRQQVSSKTRDRPRSKGSNHGDRSFWEACEPHSTESAQRRIHSAENQHRIVGPPRTSSASALDHYPPDEDGSHGPEDIPIFPQELKRPLSRKKGPSASAAAGLGAFSGPARLTDAFEQRKTRQPIPVESWGPRPPSRHGLPPKAAPLDDSGLDDDPKLISPSSRREQGGGGAGRPGSRAGSDQVSGVTWATARGGVPVGRSVSDTRRGRERRTPGRGAPEDLGVLGRGTRSPNQQLSKNLSGVFDSESGPRHFGAWDPDATDPLEVSGCGLDGPMVTNTWPGSPASSTSPAQRRGRHAAAELVSVEDFEADDGGYCRDAAPPVIITRGNQSSKNRGDPRRGRDQRGSRDPTPGMPFSTSLDVGFLSLFAN